MPINSLQEANAILKQYNIHFNTSLAKEEKQSQIHFFKASKSLSAKQEAKVSFESLAPADQVKLMYAVRKLQKLWQTKTSKDTLIPVNSNGFHRAEVIRMLNGPTTQKTIHKNINLEKREKLLAALQSNDWRQPIFADEYILQIAMAAFINEEIATHPMETILGFHEASIQLDETKRDIQPYAILTPEGEPTAEAEKLLFPNLSTFMMQKYNDEIKRSFIWLMRSVIQRFPSENLFYTYKVSSADTLAAVLKIRKTTIASQEVSGFSIRKGAIQSTSSNSVDKIIHVSASAHDAFRVVYFGINNFFPTRVVLGELSPLDIEVGVFRNYRPKAAYFPNVKSNTNIHEFPNVEQKTKSDHDDYHADILCRMGKTIRLVLQECVSIIRSSLLSKTDKNNTALIWQLVDAEFSYFINLFQTIKNVDDKEIAVNFTMMCRQKINKNQSSVFISREGDITDEGIVCFTHMAQKIDYWHESLGFHPEYMIDPFKKYFDIAVKIQSFLSDDPIFNILIYRIYLLVNDDKLFSIWVHELNKRYPEFQASDRFSVKRNNKIMFLGVVDNENQQTPIQAMMLLFLMSVAKISMDQEIPSLSLIKPNKLTLQLITSYAIIQSVASNRPFIRINVLTPIQMALTSWIQRQDLNSSQLKQPQEQLASFIKHHEELQRVSPRTPNTLLEEDSAKLKEGALDLLNQSLETLEQRPLRRGFLLNKF